ncbi:MAG: RNA methyltransferase [Pseudomonadota bacterium]
MARPNHPRRAKPTARSAPWRRDAAETVWLFGLHAVRDALMNPRREARRLILSQNAALRLEEALAASALTPEIQDARRFDAPLDPQSVHQGAALECVPLDWGPLEGFAAEAAEIRRPLVALDRVTDPHNVGAILRSAEVFGAAAVLAPRHHSTPESGALAKTASGALERQPYLRVRNLGDALETIKRAGHQVVGLDGAAEESLDALDTEGPPVCLVLGAEGPGMRARTRELCDRLVRITAFGPFGSLNVSNAAAVALYAVSKFQR